MIIPKRKFGIDAGRRALVMPEKKIWHGTGGKALVMPKNKIWRDEPSTGIRVLCAAGKIQPCSKIQTIGVTVARWG